MVDPHTPHGKNESMFSRRTPSSRSQSPSKQSEYMKSISQIETEFILSSSRQNSPSQLSNSSLSPLEKSRILSAASSLSSRGSPLPALPSSPLSEYPTNSRPLLSSPFKNISTLPRLTPKIRTDLCFTDGSVAGSSSPRSMAMPSFNYQSVETQDPEATPGNFSPRGRSSPLRFGTIDSEFNITSSPIRKSTHSSLRRNKLTPSNESSPIRTFASELGHKSSIYSGKNLLSTLKNLSVREDSSSVPTSPLESRNSLSTSIFSTGLLSKSSSEPLKRGFGETCSIISSSSVYKVPGLSTDVRIIVKSRPPSIHHDFDKFEGKTYRSFWMLSDKEAETFKSWNTLEFERQSRLFEYYSNLQRIRFNMRRMVFHYGPDFKKAKRLTPNQQDDYRKTFVPIQALYKYLDKLVVHKLKPAYEGQMFVNDKYVLEVSRKWLINVAAKYHYISRSVVYLARLSANENVRCWITEEEQTDELARSNRFAPSAKELFSSYFIKMFTPLALILKDLAKLYEKMDKNDRREAVLAMDETLQKINTTSDYTTDLDNKISLNEDLLCSDYLYLETVDLFNVKRHLKPGSLSMEVRRGVAWTKCKLVLCDNYLLPLLEKKHKETSLFLEKPPIALQYLTYRVVEPGDKDDPYQIVIKDCGNEITHTFRTPKEQQMPTIILKTFTKDLDSSRTELFNKLSSSFRLKLVNNWSFTTHEGINYGKDSRSYTSELGPNESDLVKLSLNESKKILQMPKSVNVRPLSVAEPLTGDVFKYSDNLYYAIGTNDGLYIGQENLPMSWKRVFPLPNVNKLDVIDGTAMFVLSGEKLYRGMLADIMQAYEGMCGTEKYFKEVVKRCKGYTIGYQAERNGPVIMHSNYLFSWKDKKIKYGQINLENEYKPTMKSVKAIFNVNKVSVLSEKHFSILHKTEDAPIFYLSNLNSLTNTQMPQVDNDSEIRIRQKGQQPINAFKMPGRHQKEYEILLVYSRYCIAISYDSSQRAFTRSRNEIMLFNFNCNQASFDSESRTLFICGNRGLEAWSIPFKDEVQSDKDVRPELVTCITGNNLKLLNEANQKLLISLTLPGKKQGDVINRQIFYLCKNRGK